MNKLITKIVGAALGLTMAIGLGVAVASNSDVSRTKAADEYVSLYSANFISVSTHSYTQNKTFSLNSKSWTASVSQVNSGVFYLGCNSTNASKGILNDNTTFSAIVTALKSADAKYGQNYTTAHAYALLFDNAYNDVTKVTFGWNGGNNAFQVYLFGYTGSSWTKLSYVNYSTSGADVSGSIEWTGNATNYSKFSIVARPGAANSTATSKTIRAASFEIFKTQSTTKNATINGSDSVNVNSTWTPTNITEDGTGTVVTGATFAFATSGGATISNPNTTTGSFTATAAGTNGKVTVSATKTGYVIASKVVSVQSTEPYINLTLTSSDSAYTGQNVSISASYGNGVAGLNWSVQSGSISGAATTSNSGYSAKISNTAGTLTIRATDTGSALYNEVSVTVTKTAFTTSPAASASVAEGKTTTLSAVLNSGGTINWDSDDHSVATVSAGVVTGVAAGTATITAQSADDTSVTATCTVTVTQAPSEVVIDKDNISGFASTYAERDWTYGAGVNAISGKIKAYKNSNNIQMNSNNSCYVYNTDSIKGYITGITFTKVSGSKKLTCWVGTSVLSSDPEEAGSANDTYTWSFDAANHYTYFRVATKDSNGAIVSSAITITYQKVSTVDPTGITLDDSSAITMDTYGYGRRRLTATVEPFNANDKTVTWGTSDSSVVTVSDGVLTAVGQGSATVYATTSNYVSDQTTPDLKASVSVTVTQALYKKATFVPNSTSVATQTDDYLTDGSVSLSADTAGTWNDDKSAIQLTSGKDVIFTISGYAGMKISGIDLIMSSNGSAGGGSLTVTAGSTQIFEIASAAFSDPTWNGAYDANACDLYRATTEYVVKTSETIKFTFTANANSLYVHSVAIRYLDYSLEQWCENFLSTITCDGVDSITDDSQWDDLGIEFLDLDEDLRDIAAEATANKDSSNVIEQAMARYDLIIRKYGTSAHDDFIGRFGEGKINGPLNSANAILGNIVGNANTIAIIVVISMISVTCIGGYFFLRKRKEN